MYNLIDHPVDIHLRYHGRDPQPLPSVHSLRNHAGAGLGRHGVAVPKGHGERKLGEQPGLGRGAPLGGAGTDIIFLKDASNILRQSSNLVQGDSGGLRLGWVDLDLGCSTILLGQ